MSSEKFCLRWNDFESNISVAFRELREDKDFFDVTLACDDEQIEAHKVILSACSPFFRQVLRKNPHQHPLLYLKGVKFTDLQSVLNFMYHGEVNIAQEELNSFLSVAEELRVKGLTQGQQPGGSTQTNSQASHKPPTPAPAFKPRPPDPPQRPRAARPPQEVQNEEPEVQAVEMPSVKSEMVAQGEYEGVMEEEEGNYQDEYGEQFLGDGQEYNVMQQHDPSKGEHSYLFLPATVSTTQKLIVQFHPVISLLKNPHIVENLLQSG